MTDYRFIQIAVSPGNEDVPELLYALDETGVVWVLEVGRSRKWTRLPSERSLKP